MQRQDRALRFQVAGHPAVPPGPAIAPSPARGCPPRSPAPAPGWRRSPTPSASPIPAPRPPSRCPASARPRARLRRGPRAPAPAPRRRTAGAWALEGANAGTRSGTGGRPGAPSGPIPTRDRRRRGGSPPPAPRAPTRTSSVPPSSSPARRSPVPPRPGPACCRAGGTTCPPTHAPPEPVLRPARCHSPAAPGVPPYPACRWRRPAPVPTCFVPSPPPSRESCARNERSFRPPLPTGWV